MNEHNKNNNNNNNVDLSADYKPLSHQVAGHFHGNSKTRLGLLQTSTGCVLKAVQSPPRGLRELELYKKLFNSKNDDLNQDEIDLKLFLPIYYDTIILNDGKIYL